MTMSQINIEKESKKSAEDATAITNNAAQENKNNKKTPKDPKITIPEDASRPKKAKDDVKGDSCGCRLFFCTLLVITLIGGGVIVYQHINFFCSGLLDLEGNDMCQQKDLHYRPKYENLQKSYEDLLTKHAEMKKQHDLLTRQNAACMRNFITSISSMKQEYGEDQVDSILNQFGSAIHDANESLE